MLLAPHQAQDLDLYQLLLSHSFQAAEVVVICSGYKHSTHWRVSLMFPGNHTAWQPHTLENTLSYLRKERWWSSISFQAPGDTECMLCQKLKSLRVRLHRLLGHSFSTKTNYKLNLYIFPSCQKHKRDSSAEVGGKFSCKEEVGHPTAPGSALGNPWGMKALHAGEWQAFSSQATAVRDKLRKVQMYKPKYTHSRLPPSFHALCTILQ